MGSCQMYFSFDGNYVARETSHEFNKGTFRKKCMYEVKYFLADSMLYRYSPVDEDINLLPYNNIHEKISRILLA